MDKPRIGDDALTNLGKLFNIFGWNKKLNEIFREFDDDNEYEPPTIH